MKSPFPYLLLLATMAHGEINIQTEQSTTALAFADQASATDLINNGQSTLASVTATSTSATFPATGINDGVYANSPYAANTYFQATTDFPAEVTYDLDVSVNTNGYDITSIDTFMGWANSAQIQANQDFTVEVSLVGSSGYIPLSNVLYQPFSSTGGTYESHVKLTDTEGVIASGVDSIRFIFGDPGSTITPNPGTVIREIDVAGTPSAAAPELPAVSVNATWSDTDAAFAEDVMTSDLVNSGQPTFSSLTSSIAPQFGAGGQNDGSYGLASTSSAAFYRTGGGRLPATLTFELNVGTNTGGYVISSVQTIAGWKSGGTQTYANQKYSLEYRLVGTSTWLAAQSVDYSPFSSASNTAAISKVVLSSPTGIIASGVDAVRFNFETPTRGTGTNNGIVIQEIDVAGYAVGDVPKQATIERPSTREVIQRGDSNTADIPISGTFSGTGDRIEARAVVMDGTTNNGTTTDWQTIVTNPTAGSYSGTLSGVAAGGWYQIEVRAVTDDTPSATAVVEKVGVGDVYVTAGQSNSANDGGPAYTPTDDRVSVRLSVSGSTWRHAYDPMPIATASDGSVWSRLGDKLAAATDLPIGFICVGVGGTQTSQWVPGQSHYDDRLKPAVQSFPDHGFRAVLWHQGETDSVYSTTAVTYAARMASIISQSRIDCGWDAPWYMAEASFHPSAVLKQEEPVTAGQRATIFADPLVFIGPTTDGFHLEDANGGKLKDTVHFNAAGMADHSDQWLEILNGTPGMTPRNGNFEDNRDSTITGLGLLSDDASQLVTTDTNTDSPSILGWRILTADGQNAADGSNGIFNPGSATYAGAVDRIQSGVMSHMNGRHVAVLDGGSAGNYFLHTTRALVKPNTAHVLKVALGVRDDPSTFGGATIEILANGETVASASFSKEDLDAMENGNAAGTFTDVGLTYTTGDTVTANQVLAIRVIKTAGAGTVLDFDNVRFLSTEVGYPAYQALYWENTEDSAAANDADPDGDGLSNAMEYALGYHPLVANSLPQVQVSTGENGTVASYSIPLNPDAADASIELEYSYDLVTWYPVSSSEDEDVTSSRLTDSWTVEINLVSHPKAFFRLVTPEDS
ncbi:hypothetical protein JIN85_02335 [Luteolibacter pohnpeiensis]|uniref:Sialate O-acetylesterase domain-containing protein n=1 Tax=Luteolibacter pohnpeiensis TaxID=454153 RepID=A0A934S3I4_9BACT|nr:sialate O-acetylesterase [Luteolibacter pohnpeiensis]MBK1881233.1 hypothetical protein [Luteolibacter pohnpeiensis]